MVSSVSIFKPCLAENKSPPSRDRQPRNPAIHQVKFRPMKRNLVFIRSMRFFGGQLVTYPLLYQMKQCFPQDSITVVADDAVGQFYTSTPWVDHFVQAQPLSAKIHALRNKVDRVFTLHYSSEKYAPLSTLCRVPTRVGFRNKRLSDLFWTHTHPKNYDEYLAVANLKLLQRLHEFNIEDAAHGAMRSLAAQADSGLGTYDVVLMPGGGGGAYKRWPIESFLALSDRLKSHMGPNTRFCFIMGADEQKEAELVRRLQRPDLAVAVSRPVGEIAHLALNSRLVVANDCGPSHIAQSACVPYVSLLHEPNPQWFWQRDNSRYVLPDDGSTDIKAISVDNTCKACLDVLA